LTSLRTIIGVVSGLLKDYLVSALLCSGVFVVLLFYILLFSRLSACMGAVEEAITKKYSKNIQTEQQLKDYLMFKDVFTSTAYKYMVIAPFPPFFFIFFLFQKKKQSIFPYAIVMNKTILGVPITQMLIAQLVKSGIISLITIILYNR
jgi:hypothetical protein